MSEKPTPTLYEWAGNNQQIFIDLIEEFYDRAVEDPLLNPLFADMPVDHRKNVALWFAEILGGPKAYTEKRGGHTVMVKKHLNLNITEEQRFRWNMLMSVAADAVQLPDDPEFRSAFVAYVEWGTRMALMYSQPGQKPPPDNSTLPVWGWGEVQPYMPDED